jgi:hypothetical protein
MTEEQLNEALRLKEDASQVTELLYAVKHGDGFRFGKESDETKNTIDAFLKSLLDTLNEKFDQL